MKIYVRTLWNDDRRGGWFNDDEREGLRKYLNDMGFYVITGAGDSLDVFAVEPWTPLEIALIKKVLDKTRKSWYTILRRNQEESK